MRAASRELAAALPWLTKSQPRSQAAPRDCGLHGGVATPSSRLAPARRRAKVLKVASAGVAVAGFGVLSVVVRGAHPGSSGSAHALTGSDLGLSTRISQEARQAGTFFSGGSVAPSQPSSRAQASTQTS